MNKITITLDAGHGGSDRSNQGSNGYIEADGMLKLNLKLRDKLMSTEAFNVVLTRDKDMTLGLTERGKIAVNNKSQLFISNHSNATTDKKMDGVLTFYSVDLPTDKSVAEDFSMEIAKAMGTTNRGAKVWESAKYPNEDYLTVIDVTQDGGVSHTFLIENGFHTNEDDEAKLKLDSWLEKIAEAQFKVICKIFNINTLSDNKLIEDNPPTKISDKILKAQKDLNKLGFFGANGKKLSEDGVIGVNTLFAIKEFQYIVGLPIKEELNDATNFAMNLILNERPVLKQDVDNVIAVRYVQWKLNAPIDGIFGVRTKMAVMFYQGQKNLTVDGILGKNTWNALLG